MTDEHSCVRHFKYGTLVNYKWIGKHFGTKIRLNPEIKLHKIVDLVMKKYKCMVSPTQCKNAKRWALNDGETTIKDHYGYIRSYGKVILESNPGSTIKVGVTVNPDDKTYFYRFYVCFKGLKDEWKLGCRKGLLEAVKEVMPHAEHRQCARHMYEGFQKQYSGVEFRCLFWAACKATYLGLFNKIMDKIKRANPNAYEYLVKRDPKSWARNKPLITMLEVIRVIVLERMNTMRRLYDTWTEDICPNIQNSGSYKKLLHRFWHVIATGGQLFEVRNGSKAFGVDEQRKTCTCRLLQLLGLPCPMLYVHTLTLTGHGRNTYSRCDVITICTQSNKEPPLIMDV
ncbi:hypothetical protein Tco_1118217 [Tanacetum coccineum]